MATTYHTRPSLIIGVTDLLAAYQFDLAVLVFAQWIDRQLEKHIPLAELLDLRKPIDEEPRAYSSFAALGPVRRMKIPDSGVW